MDSILNREFNIVKLGDVADIFAGGDKPKTFSASKNDSNNIPIFANAEKKYGLCGYTDTARVLEPAVTIAARGTVGFVAIRKEPYFPIVRLISVVPRRELLDVDYLYYILKLYRQIGTGSVQPQITVPDISSRSIPLPSLHTQQKISKLLSSLDNRIEINNQINSELEALAKLIYDYWFVQFDFPDETGKPYKSSGGKMVYNEDLKREVPQGWECKTIADVANLTRGVTYSKDDTKSSLANGTAPVLRATNISDNHIDLNDMVYVSEHLVSDSQFIKKYDVLITMSSGSKDHIGKNGLYYYDEKVAFGAFCARINTSEILKFYLYMYFQSDFVSKTIRYICLGTNINNLNAELINNMRILVPKNKKITFQFNEKVNAIFKKIEINKKSNQELMKLRDWLLPMLMNGQVTVKDL